MTRSERPNHSLEFGDLTAPRMLVVSPNLDSIHVVGDYFSTAGFEVFRAESTEEALAMLAVHDAQIVVVELAGAAGDGLGVLSAIRHAERWRDLPVIVLSPDDRNHGKIRALEAGADDCVVRPVHLAELEARVRALLRRTRRVIV